MTAHTDLPGERIGVREEDRSYRVDPALLTARLRRADRTPATACDGFCCHSGVYLSLPHRDLILRHADAVRACMDAGQERDPSRWFETATEEDADFEGGVATGTEADDETGCVFLNGRGLCVLQLASMRDPSLPQLKPFFCRLFPLTVVEGEVTLDDHCQGRRLCCSAYARGEVAVIEACRPELALVVDEEELERLEARASARASRTTETTGR